MDNATDILQKLSGEDLPRLRDLMKTHLPRTFLPFNFLNTCIEWQKKQPEKSYFTIYTPDGNWDDGTFIYVSKFVSYIVYVFTLEDTCDRLCRAIKQTTLINWNNNHLCLFALNDLHSTTIKNILHSVKAEIDHVTETQIWNINKNDVLHFDISCPSDVYFGQMSAQHAEKINSAWPHRSEESVKQLATLIEMNFGVGIFLKSNDKLIAWALKNEFGGLGMIQVDEKYFRRGYGQMITKYIAKKLVDECGLEPFGFILNKNTASKAMFTKIGFENTLISAYFIDLK